MSIGLAAREAGGGRREAGGGRRKVGRSENNLYKGMAISRNQHIIGVLLLGISSTQLTAQTRLPFGSKLDLGAQAIGVVTRESPAVRGATLTEGYLSQPMLMAELSALNGEIALKATLNFEGVTLKRGELNAGIWGEGYVDRRHPHTYLHELVLTAAHDLGPVSLSAAGG